MKKAEEFRKAFGETEGSFRYCVRQTLDGLMQKEEEPVKKKISVSLVLVMVLVLLGAVGAFAATQSGLLDFARRHGEQLDSDRLVTQMDQGVYKVKNTYLNAGKSELVDVKLEELLYENGWLFATMKVTPKQAKTMVIADEMQELSTQTGEMYLNALGKIRDINEPGSMERFAGNNDVDARQSVKEYADSMGFEHVVRVATGTFIKHAEYQLLADGSLRMIVQMEYNYNQKENYPKSMVEAWISLQVLQYDENGKLPDVYGCEYLEVQAIGPLVVDACTKTSVPEDAHQINGYRGYIESVSVTPVDEDRVSIILQLDQQKKHYGIMQMSGPVVVILDESGNELYEYCLYTEIDSMQFLTGDRVRHNIVMPVSGLAEDKITIRLQSSRNHTIVYDTYTYTLK